VKPVVAALAALLALAVGAAPAGAARTQESTFQDDDLLVFSDEATVAATLDELRGLGVDRIRVSLVWQAIAPANDRDVKPEGFDAADPGDYPAGAWDRWDRVLALARGRGIDVNFNVTVPAPDWATGTPARGDIDATHDPNAAEFGAFVRAAATRYDGAHGPGRVSYWSIQNEPNQAGWLTPQWVQREGGWVEAAPRIYRGLVDAAWTALQDTGHGGDTILVGETAPKGLRTNRGETRSIDALRFIRRLYCLDENLQVLTGTAAEAQGCPATDQVAAFPAQHPGLFRATGWAHHPYELLFAPDRRPTWRDWATMANLGDLQELLLRIRLRYRQASSRATARMPLYLTEFGYQTNPPDRRGVTRARQAAYLNHAEYLAWRNRDVRTLAQFLLRDDGEPVGTTFQSGLLTQAGQRKPAWAAYRFPVHVVRRSRGRITVWGIPRPAPDGSRPRVQVQFRRRGARRWRRVRTLTGDRTEGYVNGTLRAPGTGALRLAWNGLLSRSVQVRPGRRAARAATRRDR
jgi:hypothetical protein